MVFWPSLGLRVDVEAERATLRVLMVDDEDRAVRLDRAASCASDSPRAERGAE